MFFKKLGLILSIFLFAQTLFAANKKLSIHDALPHLSTIEPYALHVGYGHSRVYVFVDPLCPHSQDFIELIMDSQKMQKKYSYSIFLYHLYKFDSKNVINYIYSCQNRLECLKEVMLEHHLHQDRHKQPSFIETIEKKAKALGVDKRPYLFIQKVKAGE